MTTVAVEAETSHGWFARYRSVLSRRDVRRLFSALIISSTGDWAYNVALVAYLFERTHSLGWVAAGGIARIVPRLLTSTYGGVLAERFERVRLMMTSDLISAVWQVALVVLAVMGGPPALALVLTALAAVTAVVYQPATAAMIPSLVDEEDLAAANALNASIDQLVVLLGPALAGVLLAVVSSAAVFALDAVSFLISALLVAGIHTRSKPVDVTEGGTAGILAQMLVGFRTLLGLSAARTLVAYCVLVTFIYGADTILFMGVSVHKLGTGTHGFGYLMAGLGVGGVLLATTVDKLAGSRRLAAIILAGALGYALPTALLVVVHSPLIAFLIQVFRGGATLVVDVLAITALQRAVEPSRLARVFGVFFAVALSAATLGMLITPLLVSALGLNGALVAMAVGPAALALAGFPTLIAVDRENATQTQEVAERVSVMEKLGLFSGARRPTLERLAAGATDVGYEPGTAIIREGEEADALYVLIDGEVQVSARGENSDEERLIRVMTGPTFFGEIGVLERIPRTASVTAIGDCQCLRLDGDRVYDALTSSPLTSSLMETARTRLAVTHPSRQLSFEAAAED